MTRRNSTFVAFSIGTAGACLLMGCQPTTRSAQFLENGQPRLLAATATNWQYPYVYHPESEVYFEPYTRNYFWQEDGTWFKGASLPATRPLDPLTAIVVSLPYEEPGLSPAMEGVLVDKNATPDVTPDFETSGNDWWSMNDGVESGTTVADANASSVSSESAQNEQNDQWFDDSFAAAEAANSLTPAPEWSEDDQAEFQAVRAEVISEQFAQHDAWSSDEWTKDTWSNDAESFVNDTDVADAAPVWPEYNNATSTAGNAAKSNVDTTSTSVVAPKETPAKVTKATVESSTGWTAPTSGSSSNSTSPSSTDSTFNGFRKWDGSKDAMIAADETAQPIADSVAGNFDSAFDTAFDQSFDQSADQSGDTWTEADSTEFASAMSGTTSPALAQWTSADQDMFIALRLEVIAARLEMKADEMIEEVVFSTPSEPGFVPFATGQTASVDAADPQQFVNFNEQTNAPQDGVQHFVNQTEEAGTADDEEIVYVESNDHPDS